MVLRSFKLKKDVFNIIEYKLCIFEDIEVTWVEENIVWGCWVQLYICEGIKGIWGEEGPYWII